MYWIRLLHVYAGLVLSLLLFLLALTGTALIYKHEFWQLRYAELRAPDAVPGPAQQAAALEAAWSRYGDRLISVKMPEPGVPAFHLYQDDGEAFLSLDGQRWIDEWQAWERPMAFLFDLHAHLLTGATGEVVGGAAGLAGCLMALTGLVLWFPARRQFSLFPPWPGSLSRRELLKWHRDMGMLLSPLLLLLMLTGSGMVFYAQAQKILNGVFGDAVPRTILPDPGGTQAFVLPDGDTLRRVSGHFPATRLTYYYAQDSKAGLNRFRLRRSCELHPNGLTFLYTGARSGKVAVADDACAAPPGERLVRMIYPLHAAKTGSEIYRLLSFLGGLVLAGLALSGVVTYCQKLRRRRKI